MMNFLKNAVVGLALAGLGGVLAVVPAQADTVAYDNSGTGNQAWNGNLAMDFNVGSAGIVVTELGVFDDQAPIPSGTASLASGTTIDVGIYNYGTPTLAVGPETFTGGTTYTAVDSDIFQTLATPVYLAPGNYTIDAVGYNGVTENGNYGYAYPPYSQPIPYTTALNSGGVLTFFGTSHYDGSASLDNPGTPDGGPVDRYAAGTFAFNVAPEPAQMAVYAFVALGLGGLMLRARKRQLTAQA